MPLDIYKIKYDKTQQENKELNEIIDNYSEIDTRLPNCFNGDFFGYLINSNYVYEEKIDTFDLTIDNRSIKMTIHHYAKDADNGNRITRTERILYGKIIHNQSQKTEDGLIVVDFKSKEDDYFCIMSFNSSQFRTKDRIHYRRGALLIQKRGGNVPLSVIQSFVFTKKKININNPENEKCIRGLLKMNSEFIYIDKERAEKYYEDDLFISFFNKGNTIMEKHFFVIKESSLREIATLDTKQYLTFLKLKDESTASTLFTLSEEDNPFHHIATLYDDYTFQSEHEQKQ